MRRAKVKARITQGSQGLDSSVWGAGSYAFRDQGFYVEGPSGPKAVSFFDLVRALED